MIENHPCYGCRKAWQHMVSPTNHRKANYCKEYKGRVVTQKCADYPKFAKKKQVEN